MPGLEQRLLGVPSFNTVALLLQMPCLAPLMFGEATTALRTHQHRVV